MCRAFEPVAHLMIAVIADDLTGAAEIAGLGWRHGLSAEILEPDQPVPRAELVVYNSDSRHCPSGEARRRVTRILQRLRQHKPDWLYKKVDSVLRGNVVPEIEAALKTMRWHRCLLVSANPDAGRTVRGGVYRIHGVPLDRTDFRNDPHHPRDSAKVLRLLGQPESISVNVLRQGSVPAADGVSVGEAESFEHVRHWAQMAAENALAAGGADFFRALLLMHGCTRRRDADRFRLYPRFENGTRTLFVSGSLADSSLRFLNRCRSRGWPVFTMSPALLAARRNNPAAAAAWAQEITGALQSHPKVVAAIGVPLLPGKQTPLRLGRILTGTVRLVLSAAQPELICVEGGETAARLMRRMAWKRFHVEAELSTGVTMLRPRAQGSVLLVVKPGSYPWPHCLID